MTTGCHNWHGDCTKEAHMGPIDFTIIYLACGSPFAVYHITKRTETLSLAEAGMIAATFFLWPAFALPLALRRLFPARFGNRPSLRDRRGQIRSEIERIAFAEGPTAAVFEFREVYERFTGLFEAADLSGAYANELFKVTGHVNRDLASRCLARRNREKLDYHRSIARNEFVDLIADLSSRTPAAIEILRLAIELADHLGDEHTASDLGALDPGLIGPGGNRMFDLEKKVWRSRTHSATPVN